MSCLLSITDVCRACVAGDIATLQSAKAHGQIPDLTLTNTDGLQPHECAVTSGSLQCLQWLATESGQCIDFFAGRMETLPAAAYLNHVDVLQWLYAEAVSAGQESTALRKPLKVSAENRCTESLEWIVATVSAADWFLEDVPELLGAALETGNIPAMECLLSASKSRLGFLEHSGIFQKGLYARKPSACRWLLLNGIQYLELSLFDALEGAKLLRRDETDSLAIRVFGIDPETEDSVYALLVKMMQQPSKIAAIEKVTQILDVFGVDPDVQFRKKYYLSATVRRAAEAGLIVTTQDLEKLVQQSSPVAVRKL